jgi:hypothetical protein
MAVAAAPRNSIRSRGRDEIKQRFNQLSAIPCLAMIGSYIILVHHI